MFKSAIFTFNLIIVLISSVLGKDSEWDFFRSVLQYGKIYKKPVVVIPVNKIVYEFS